MAREQLIHIHASAPPKPPEGAACNGCGVCCLLEPCPIGMLVSRQRRGACRALEWVEADRRYRCGMVTQPQAHLPAVLHGVAAPIQALARRMISAGSGCDCGAETA